MTDACSGVRSPPGSVRVTILGSGDAFGSGGRLHSAYLVESPGATFLMDCGPTVLQSMKRLRIDPGILDFVLLSHHHGDHFGGVPFLFMEYRYDAPRSRPFTVCGPPGVQQRVEGLFSALYERTATEPLPFPMTYIDLHDGVACETHGVRVVPVLVPHATELVCFAFRVEVAGRTILYSGDTAWTEVLVTQARGADLFICECTTYETRMDIHVAYPEIAARARAIDCRRLLLSHLGRETLGHLDELNLECATDGMTLEL
jgi:ribonuclease BN (tRNA processing enzyme)